ncbi:MAG: PAS domain S-box protein [Coriobacteriia bacterium]|nr:PAS domain S-box protein [Coriobacteriia bacterium]
MNDQKNLKPVFRQNTNRQKASAVPVNIYRELEAYNQMMVEIQHRDNLLDTVNRAAVTLLETDNAKNTEAAIQRSMELIGRSFAVDRVQIWRNELTNGELHFTHTYEWLSETGKQKSEVPIGLSFPYSSKPLWEQMFLRGEYINAPLSKLEPHDQMFLQAYDIKSIVIIPLFLQDELWGFFSVDDCVNERVFSVEEINILQSASLMMASALLRNEIISDISTTAKQLDAVIANYQGVIWSADRNGDINLFNGLYLKEAGIDPSRVVGKNLEVLKGSSKHLDLYQKFHQALSEQQAQDWISEIDNISFHARVMPLFNDHGKVTGVVGSFDDVSEMIKLQNKLKEENINALEQFAMIWDKVESGMLIIDMDNRTILDANPATARIYGTSIENIIGKLCYEFFGEHACPIMDLNQSMDRQERLFTLADGSTIPVLKSVSCITYNGRPALLESFTDISYMKEVEKQAHMLELTERVQVMLDANPNVNMLFDDQLKIVDCNQAAIEFMGFRSKAEMLQGFSKRINEAVQAAVAKGYPTKPPSYWFPKALKEGFVKFESELVFDEKVRKLNVEINRIPYKDSFGIVAYIIDMTDVFERENELKQARETNELQLAKLNTAVQATKIGLWDMEIVKSDPVNPQNTFYWSDELRQMLGYEDDDDFPNILSSWSDRLHPEDKDWVLKEFEDFFLSQDDEATYDIEYRMIKKQGDCGYYRATGKTIRDLSGDAIHVAGAMIDITETKNILLDTERQKIEAEAANKAKSDFLSTMSHEIRTPINAILGITEIQMQNEGLDRELLDALNKIYMSGDLLLGIINDILDLSRIEAGKLELTLTKYQTASLISDTAQLNMMRIGSKPIEFEMTIDEQTPLYAFGDELRVKQILNNILSNAFKYTIAGKVKLKIGFLPINESPDGQVVLTFSVSDTGQGMSKEQIAKIFDEYSRFNIETNRSTEGTGLGMSITQNLLKMMKGSLFIESELGVGSTFTVHIPQTRVNDEVLGKDLTESLCQFRLDSRSQMKRTQVSRDLMPYGSVLVVDDVETNNYVTKGLLAPYKLQVETVNSGYVAIELIKSGKSYDIVFMDHMMPGMDGIEATQIIRSLGYEKPIVALTANAVVGQAEIFIENGFDDYVSKPIDVRQLNTVLNRWVRDMYPPEVVQAARMGNTPSNEPALTVASPLAEASLLADASSIALDKQLAGSFLKDAHKSYAVLKELIEKASFDQDELRLYVINIHGIKGALANIRKTDLADTALQLETAGRNNDIAFITLKTGGFLQDLLAFIDEIEETLAQADPDEPSENAGDEASVIDNEYLCQQLAVIKSACLEYNEYTAEQVLDDLRKAQWPKAYQSLLDDIAALLLHSNFDDVVSSIDAFINRPS